MSSAIRLTWASVSHPHGIILALRIPCHLPTFWFQRHCFDPYNISARACVSSAQNTLATSRFLRSRRKGPPVATQTRLHCISLFPLWPTLPFHRSEPPDGMACLLILERRNDLTSEPLHLFALPDLLIRKCSPRLTFSSTSIFSNVTFSASPSLTILKEETKGKNKKTPTTTTP